MLTLEQNCEVCVLRNDVSLGEWIHSSQGKKLETKQRLYSSVEKEDNRCCGDMSRVMATFSVNSEAVSCKHFGKFAAICGNCKMMESFLNLQEDDKLVNNTLVECMHGSCTSGDVECLESCLAHCLKCSIDSSEMLTRLLSCLWFCRFDLKWISPTTFEWISSKWTNDTLLKFVDAISPYGLSTN